MVGKSAVPFDAGGGPLTTPDRPSTQPPHMPAVVRAMFRAAAALSVLPVIITALGAGEVLPSWWDSWSFAGIELLAAGLLTARVIMDRRERAGWGAMAAAIACASVGDLVSPLAFGDTNSDTTPIAFAGYSGFVDLAFVGLVLLLRPRLPKASGGMWLDGLVVGLGLLAVGSAVLNRLGRAPSSSLWESAVAVWYGLGVLILVAMQVVALTLIGRRPSRVWWSMTAAFACMSIANWVLLTELDVTISIADELVDALWQVGLLLLAWAGWICGGPRIPSASVKSMLSVATPAVSTLAAVGVLVAGQFTALPLSSVVLACLTLLLGTARIVLDVRDAIELGRHLEVARDQALAATVAKSAFLATMSHEIRTPMNAVIGMTELLMGTELTQQQRGYAETVQNGGNLLLDVINDVLDFSKIEAGEFELEHEPFDLGDVIGDVMDLLSLIAEAKELELTSRIDPSCPRWIIGDATRLRQVLVNLLGNGLKFTDKGGVSVDIGPVARQSSDRVSLRFAVVDAGVGMSADQVERLFRPFEQLDSSTTRVYGGTGLGLVISRNIVRAMGGDITVTSRKGKGSTFTFVVAFDCAGEPEAAAPRVTRLAGRSVLVVDDNTVNLQVVQTQLHSWGVRCITATSSQTALAMVDSVGAVVDAALLDMDMPTMNGIDLARELRRRPGWSTTPMLLLTSLGSPATAARGNDFCSVLTKPVRGAALRKALLSLPFDDHPAEPEPPAAEIQSRCAVVALRVLLAEDNLVNQRVGALMVSKGGHLVDVVGNGRDAVDAIRAAAYDIVLMDVQMPIMDGLEATRRIRQLGTTVRQPRIIALTANVSPQDRADCQQAGMDDYLPKPLRTVALTAALQQVSTAELLPAGDRQTSAERPAR